jgi:hypothetical protein
MPRITSKALLDEIEEKYTKHEQETIDLNRARYKKYQEWVLNKCTDAMDYYTSKKIFTDDNAFYMFDEFEIGRVDHSLLSPAPEVSRVFNHVLQKILAELKGKPAFEIEIQMALTKKKTLEEF